MNLKKIIFLLVLFALVFAIQGNFKKYDFIQYWSSAHLIDEGINPYTESNIQVKQTEVRGFAEVIRIWNPPLIFPLIYGLKFFDNYDLILNIWVVISILTYFFCVLILLRKFIPQLFEKYSIYFLLIFFSFPCFWAMLHMAQIGFVLLLSVTLFILLKEKEKNFLAGLLLSVTFIKPHSLYLLYIFVFGFDLKQKKYQTFLGFLIGVLALFFGSIFIESEVWNWYIDAMKTPPVYFKTTTLGSLLIDIFGYENKNIRFLPMLLFIPISIYFLFKKLNQRQVFELCICVIPLSQLTSPYGWPADQLAMIPAILLFFSYCEKNLSNKEFEIKKIILIFLALTFLAYIHITMRAYSEMVWYTAIVSCICLVPVRSYLTAKSPT